MATPVNQPPAKSTNYLPWILGGCTILVVLGVIMVGVAGVIFHAMTPGDGGGRRIGFRTEQAMMGFQNVYSPTTGEHWEASLNEGFPPN
jgi:hypothetical protein